MSFLYPRTASVYRESVQASVGAVAYSGTNQATQLQIATGLPCSIQHRRISGALAAKLPADIAGKTMWQVFMPLSAVPKGTIKDRDYLVDDEGRRYQVTADYWSSLGYTLYCERLET